MIIEFDGAKVRICPLVLPAATIADQPVTMSRSSDKQQMLSLLLQLNTYQYHPPLANKRTTLAINIVWN